RDAMPQWLRANKGTRDVRLCVSDETDVPVAVGLFDAMILVPRSLLDRLSEPEVDQICLHELAHLRRADDWTNGLQRLINALLGWNPAAQFVGQQLDLEREVACDDWVLSFVKTVRPYALCLTKMAETASWPRQPIPAPGVFATRKHISLRIERLLGAGRNIATNLSFAPAAAAVGIVGAIALVIALVAPSVAAPCITSITVVTNEKPVPVPASKPAKIVYVQSKEVSMPATRVSLPATHVSLPATHVSLPATHVTLPETHVTLPEKHLTVPETHVTVPETNLTLPATHFALPGAQVTLPKMRIPMPLVDVGSLNTEISHEIDRSMSVAQGAAASGSSRACSDCDFRNVDWSGKDMRGVSYSGADFSGSKLVGTNFSSAKFDGADFSRADLRNASFRGARLTGCDFSDANLHGVDFTGAKLSGCEFTRARLTSTELRDVLSTCAGCDFSHANLSGVNLSGVRASGDDFTGADLRGVNFSGAQLTGIDFTKAQLDGANLAGATLTGCDMSGVDLTHVDLSRTKLIGMDLTDQKHPR
ncbi:MAG: pentapeptide repeat-containing protein, partial [Candidatus Cybelea sp.]